MALNITKLAPLALKNGAMPQAPVLDAGVSALTVAMGAQSAVLSGPALLCLIPDEDTRIAVVTSGAYSAPAATGVKLKANSERYFELPKGNWYINAVAG